MNEQLKIYKGTFLGSILEKQGKNKEGKAWNMYKVSFTHAKQDGEASRVTFSTFYDATKLSMGNNYEIKFAEEEYKNKQGLDVKSKKAVFFTKIGDKELLGFEKAKPTQEIKKEYAGIDVEEIIPPITDIEFVETYRTQVNADLWSVQHFAGTYLGIVANEKEYQRLKKLFNEKLLGK
jgi:hypothetical protein